MRDYPLPPRADQFAELVRLRLEEIKDTGRTRESVSVDWNGNALHVEVIDLPLKDLYYNPATHRIRAQRSHDSAREAELEKSPWGAQGQEYLGSLLKSDPSDPTHRDPVFDRLKEDLAQYGQNEPGLITRQGILVNGNTRAAALRELGSSSMRVGVLPESFTWSDINAIELSLQLRQDHRREYSYINHLLAVEEQANAGLTPETIARIFRIQVKTFRQDRWILQLVRDQIESSKSDGASLRMVDFEESQEKLKELHRDYLNLKEIDPDQAEILKESRMAAIALGFSKTDVRFVESNFHEKYLSETAPKSLFPDSSESTNKCQVAVPGLGIAVPGDSSEVAVAREVCRKVLQAKARMSAPSVDTEQRAAAQALSDEAENAFDRAIDKAGRDVRLRKRKQKAPERLRDACASIDFCVDELVKARGSRSLDEAAFEDAVVQLRESIRQLARQAGRGNKYPGEGIGWLMAAAGLEFFE